MLVGTYTLYNVLTSPGLFIFPLSHIMKIFEKQIKTPLMFYLEDNALISTDQSAYRKQHNTQTALHKVVDDCFYNVRWKLDSCVFS